ncbi:pilus assembly protein PilM [bacterium]|jgi:type IV pilus assembly protein PilM|nr:pilus assembly protein PilM [bacterium]
MAGPKRGLFSGLSGLFSFGGGNAAVGLSIGSSSIKLVELQRSGKSWKLLHFGTVQLTEDVIVNHEIINQLAVNESIKTLINQLRLKSKNVCISLSGTAVIIKRMSMDIPNTKDLQDQIFWEAEQYLPFDASEVVMDFQILSRSKEGRTDILLVAVKKSILEVYMSCVEAAGLVPKFVDVDFFALQNVFEANYPSNPSEAVALVDIGASSTKLVISHAGIPVFTKESLIGGTNLTTEIQRQLNLSFTDAESLKIGGVGGGLPQEVSDLMHIMSENFAGEIKKSIDFYNASSSGAPVSYILLAGGSSKIPGLPKVVEDHAGLPTQVLNPFNSITFDPAIFTNEYVAAIGPVAAVPIGLALRAGSS